jgi:hypothetical protein
MCGIVGQAGESSKKNDDVVTTLLVLDQLRGIDSTGVAVIPKSDYDVNIAKGVGNAYDLMGTHAFTKAMNCATRAIIGHNRSATSGTVTKRNAHPFENESIVGVHNGTLQGKHRLADSSRFVVDSENLYHHIDKHGLKDCLTQLEGAWSLVWWDKAEETLNFLRNDQRPMFITWTLDFKSMFWASEKWMLSVALSRNGVTHTDIEETVVDTLYSYPISKEGAISKPRLSAAPSTYRGYTSTQYSGKWYGNPQQTQQTQNQTAASVAKQSAADNKYEGRFNTLLEVRAKSKDPFGAEYYVCFDPVFPGHSIRLYIKDSDKEVLTDREITGNIAPINYIEGSRNYYKVNHSSVKLVEKKGEEVEYFLDHKGNKLADKIWHLRYGCCSMCGGHVNPRFDFKFAKTGDPICHECAADEDVKQMIAFM